MRKILLSFLLIMCSTLFFGCSASAPITFVDTKFTSIYLTVSYDADNLSEIGINGVSDALIQEEIEDKAEDYMNQMLKKYRNLINTLNSNGILTDNEKIIYKNHLNLYCGWDEEIYIIELRFYSNTASRLFLRYGAVSEGVKIAETLFTTVTTEEYTNLFTETPDDLITTSVKDYFDQGVSDVILTTFGADARDNFDGLFISYLFLTQNTRLHSNGTVVSTREGDLHYFEETDENLFSFYRIEANRYVWYLFALTVTMVFVAIALIVIYFKKK